MELTPPVRSRKVVTHQEELPAFVVEAGHTTAADVDFIQIRNRRSGEAMLSIANERAVALARAILRAYAHNVHRGEYAVAAPAEARELAALD